MTNSVKTIGIGMGADAEKVITSACTVNIPCDIVCYSRPGVASVPRGHPHVRLTESSNPDATLVSDLMTGTINAAVRGSLPGEITLQMLKAAAGVTHLERVALLETAGGKKFMFAPVGIAEGWTVTDKIALIQKGRVLARRFGLSEQVGVLSGGRFGGVGWHSVVDRSMADAELVAKLSGAAHYEFRIEDAIKSCGLIIAPDGISGNLIFRTLAYLGAGYGHGAPVVNIDKIFVDSSRAQPDYRNALLLAASLLE
ncbi:MAG: methanogenesis marker protein Mmp4/MtxX [Methanoregula sp.]|nr:methanogenesis marker protein Mmp4/MtxX [Methanoregula sp.]